MRGAQICPRKSYRNYSRSSSSGNDAPRTSLGCGRGGGCGRSTACPAMNVFCAKQGDVQSRLGRVDKLNPDLDAGKQHEGGEALDQLVVAGGDTA